MKYIAAAVIALIFGYLLGGLSPRRELADANKKVADLEGALYDAKHSHSGGPRFLPFPGLEDLPSAPPPAPKSTRTMPVPADGASPAEAEPTPTPFDAVKAFDLAVDAQRMRTSQVRSALQEKAKLDHREMEKVDDVIGNMNEKLTKYGEEMLKLVESGQEPDPLQMLQLTHEVSGILADAQQQYQESVGDGYTNLDPSSQQVWNFVDLDIFRDAVIKAQQAGQIPPP